MVCTVLLPVVTDRWLGVIVVCVLVSESLCGSIAFQRSRSLKRAHRSSRYIRLLSGLDLSKMWFED